MRTRTSPIAAGLVPLVAAGCALLAACTARTEAGVDTGAAADTPTAAADLKDANGETVGTVRLAEVGGGVRVIAETRGMTPGEHGFHIHETGACEPPDFKSAGSHFNPGERQHGLLNPEGPHAGDLSNLAVDAEGRGRLSEITDRVTLSPGPTSLLDADGSAIVVHAGRDDQQSQPSGESGDPIACGVVERS